MKIIISAIALVIGMVIGNVHQTPKCMDPNTNTPIDCSMLK